MSVRAEEELAILWARDLSTCTKAEILDRWQGHETITALDRVDPLGFEKRVEHHNPFYYVAERVFFDSVLNNRRFLYAPLHRDKFCAALEKVLITQEIELDCFLCLAPRHTFKSTFFHGVGPTTMALRMKHIDGVDARQLLTHHKDKKAWGNARRLKGKFMRHPWLRKVWPEFCPDPGIVEWGSRDEFTFPCASMDEQSEASITASGLKSSQTGGHYHVRWPDDLVDVPHINSRAAREETAQFYDATQYTGDIGGFSKEIVSGTRYHVADLYGRMIKSNNTGAQHIHIMIIPAREEDGTLAHPYRLSDKVLNHMQAQEMSRTGNDILYNLQMQNNPGSTNLIAGDEDWIRTCSADEIPTGLWRCILVDPAWKGAVNLGTGDCASIQVWGFKRTGIGILKVMLDGVHSDSLSGESGTDEIFRLARKWRVHHIAPEEKGGYSFRTSLRTAGITRNWPVTIIDLKSMANTGKPLRISTFMGSLQGGRVMLADTVPETLHRAFREQVRDFPQLDKDDALDCAAYTEDPSIVGVYVPMALDDDDEIGEGDESGEAAHPYWERRSRYGRT